MGRNRKKGGYNRKNGGSNRKAEDCMVGGHCSSDLGKSWARVFSSYGQGVLKREFQSSFPKLFVFRPKCQRGPNSCA